MDEKLVADWNFARDISGGMNWDRSSNDHHGLAVNLPSRGITRPSWRGRNVSPGDAADTYNAIYFHEDDFYDAQWDARFDFAVPEAMRSGVYTARLVARGEERIRNTQRKQFWMGWSTIWRMVVGLGLCISVAMNLTSSWVWARTVVFSRFVETVGIRAFNLESLASLIPVK